MPSKLYSYLAALVDQSEKAQLLAENAELREIVASLETTIKISQKTIEEMQVYSETQHRRFMELSELRNHTYAEALRYKTMLEEVLKYAAH